jgi:inner membrane transporter RhtA
VQFGAALATTLFAAAGPLGVVALRTVGAAFILVLLTRPWRRRWTPADLRGAGLLGLVIVVMNACLYLAIDRLPLATGVTLELLGPMTLALVTAASWRQRFWAVPAACGVALLGGSLHLRDLPGVIFALAAAGAWAAYILLNRQMGASGSGLPGLCLATVAGAVIALPAGAGSAGAALLRPGVLAAGLAVGVLSSAVPYSLDLLALRRLPTTVFGVLTSLNPAVAALAGFVILGDRLSAATLAGIAGVVIASAGAVTSCPHRRARLVHQPVGSREREPIAELPSVADATPESVLPAWPHRRATSLVSDGV